MSCFNISSLDIVAAYCDLELTWSAHWECKKGVSGSYVIEGKDNNIKFLGEFNSNSFLIDNCSEDNEKIKIQVYWEDDSIHSTVEDYKKFFSNEDTYDITFVIRDVKLSGHTS